MTGLLCPTCDPITMTHIAGLSFRCRICGRDETFSGEVIDAIDAAVCKASWHHPGAWNLIRRLAVEHRSYGEDGPDWDDLPEMFGVPQATARDFAAYWIWSEDRDRVRDAAESDAMVA